MIIQLINTTLGINNIIPNNLFNYNLLSNSELQLINNGFNIHVKLDTLGNYLDIVG